MGYCTLPQLINALRPIGLPANQPSQTAADLPEPQLNDAIAEASSLVDSAIGGRYLTPVAPVDQSAPTIFPHPIDFYTRDIAAYLATCTYRGSVDFTNDDPIYRRYAVALAALNDVKNGVGVLPIPEVDPNTGATGVGEPVNPYLGKLFGPEDFDLTYKSLPGVPSPTAWGEERGWF